MKTCYLASPIGSMSIAEAQEWRDYVQGYFYETFHKVDVRSPLRGKAEENRSTYTDAEIVLRDKRDIHNSDFVLVYWPDRCVSTGTTMEVLEAYNYNIPLIFVGSWVRNDIWMRHHITKIHDTLHEALTDIERMWL